MEFGLVLFLSAAAFAATAIGPLFARVRPTKAKVVWVLKLSLFAAMFVLTIFISVISSRALTEGSLNDAFQRSINLLIILVLLRLFSDLITAFMALIGKDDENGLDR